MNKHQLMASLLLISFNSWSFGELPIPNEKTIASQTANITCASVVPNSSEKDKIHFVKHWSIYVANQAFALKYDNIDYQLKQLQVCFSQDGWSQFDRALKKSGNFDLITKHQLSASTQIIGPVEINHHPSFSSWSAVVPLRIVYQNQTDKISQEIDVHLTINQLSNNRLAVIQIVGKPAQRNLAIN